MVLSEDLKALLASFFATLISFFKVIGMDNLAHNLEIYAKGEEE